MVAFGALRGSGIHQDVIGRGPELELVDRVISRARVELAGLLVSGEAGIGKTSVWAEAVERGRSGGARVLRAAPAESERSLTLVGLTDLLAEIGPEELAPLPTVQRHALEIALLRSEPTGQLPDQRTLSVATATALRQLSAADPLILAIDDVQWLDDATAAILAYALRRLADRPIGLLLAARGTPDKRAGQILDGVPAERRERVQLGPLPLAALHQLFLARFGRSFPRLALVRIEEASAGNPLYALEIARAMADAGPDGRPDGPVPLPESLAGLLEARLARLPDATQAALLLAATATEPTIDALRRADPRAPDMLAPAFEAGLATMDRRAVRFSHPLLAQAVLLRADPDELQRAHAAFARTATSDEVRARHLAGAAAGRDAGVAAALEMAAATIRDRGATLDAAALYERAASLTPESDADGAMRRARLAAETLFIDVSDYVQADRVLETAIAAAPPGPERAEALSLRGIVRYYHGDTPDAVRLGEAAVGEAGDDPGRLAKVLGRAAFLVMQVDLERGNEMVGRALALLAAAPDRDAVDPDIRANLLLLHASSELGLVRGYPAHEAAKGRALRTPHGRSWEHDGVSGIDYGLARQLDELDRAIAMTERFIEEKVGPGGDDPFNFVSLSGLQVLRGDLDAAEESAQAAIDGYAHEGADVFPAWRLRGVALVAAYRGRLDEAEGLAREGVARAVASGDLALEVYHRHILGFVALSRQDAAAALDQLAQAAATAAASGTRHPGRFKIDADLAEAAVAAGELPRAEPVVRRLEDAARIAPTPWTRVGAARSRALLHAAGTDLDAAGASIGEAISACADLPMPFERGRTLLLAGTIHRRRKEKRLADERLREAIAIFERIGTPIWADRARAELGRVGRRPAAPGDLTETERQVAELAAAGLSARQIGERAFLAPKTVGNVLGRVYAKLGIHTRAELGARMGDEGVRDRSG
ncbi:MAG TPA: LuxR family transcriptional regulator [Candidatus Limnocylindrales bacterium]|nr:LuxR family transcriptional regulator [Candidatus Limnocylindrales bacterium]